MKKIRIRMVGTCPSCGREFKRAPPVDCAVCLCETLEGERKGLNPLPEPISIPLKPVLFLSNREYAFFSRAAAFAGVTTEELLNCYLIEAIKEKLATLQSFPTIVVSIKGEEVSAVEGF